jgi:hypothetical protein
MSVRNKFEIINKASMSTAARPDTPPRTNTPQDEFFEANVTKKQKTVLHSAEY